MKTLRALACVLCVCERERREERSLECAVEPTTVSECLIPIAKNKIESKMVERILEEKNASTAAAKEFGSLRLNAGSASGSGGGNNNNASGSGDSGVGGSNNNSCSQSQSGES